MSRPPVQELFSKALDKLVAQIRQDRTVLAAILCGSLSHDTVWDKSDIDLALVTVDDRKGDGRGISLYADGLNTHAIVMSRTEFRKTVEGSVANSFMHSLLAKGRLLYTHDESISPLLGAAGADGQERSADPICSERRRRAACPLQGNGKWLVTREVPTIPCSWIRHSATARRGRGDRRGAARRP